MKQILVCYFILFSQASFSQIKTPALNPNHIVKMTLRKTPSDFPLNININGIRILDSRNDTTDVGYSPETKARKYCFKGGFINEMNNWFLKYLSITANNINGTTLFVDIKKLRISDQACPKIMSNGEQGQPNNGWNKGVIVKIEYYLQKDSSFTPLYRFDSIIPLRGDLERYAEEFISIGLRASLVKLFTLEASNALFSKNKILLGDILRVNKREHDLPVYSVINHKKGIYKTFEDFKKNTISPIDFELREGRMGDILYVKENGNEYPLRNAWGFCDGEADYINSGNKYSQLVRSGYNFYFSGIKAISRKTEHVFTESSLFNYATDTGIKRTSFSIDMRYLQLDMKNGMVY